MSGAFPRYQREKARTTEAFYASLLTLGSVNKFSTRVHIPDVRFFSFSGKIRKNPEKTWGFGRVPPCGQFPFLPREGPKKGPKWLKFLFL